MRTKEICSKWGITPSAVAQHFERLKKAGTPIVKGAKKIELQKQAAARVAGGAAVQTANKVISEFESKRKDRIEQVKEMAYRSSMSVKQQFAKVQKEIADGARTLEGSYNAFKSLRMAEAFLKLNKDNLYDVLDIATDVDDRDLPTLVFEDLTETEILAIQAGEDEFDDDIELPDAPDDDDIIEDKA